MWYTIYGQDLKPEDQLVNVKELDQKITETKEDIDNNYVKKEEGKGLSTNDYTNQEKNKLFGLDAYQIIIDDNVYNLTSSSTSQEIIDAFGGEEVFTKMLNDIRVGKKVAMVLYKDDSGTYKLYPVYLSYWENNNKSGLSLVEYFQGAYQEIGFDCSNNTWRVSNEAENYELVNSEDVLLKNNNNPYNPTSDYHPATKKYVDDSIANAGTGSSGESATYIEENSSYTPFVLGEHEPGVYVFKNQPYIKARTSNKYSYPIQPVDNIIYLCKTPLAEDPDGTIVASFLTNNLQQCRIKLSSTYMHGIDTEYSNNSKFFVDTNSNEKIYGTKTFSDLPKLEKEKIPTNDLQLVPKKYVDDAIAAALGNNN